MVTENSRWLKATIAFALTATAAFSVFIFRKKSRSLDLRFRDLEISLKAALKNCVAERQGRIRAQQALRKVLVEQSSEKSKPNSYPMTPIATVQSCFSTRNGTPRQPLLVPLARACLVLDSSRVPPESLEGFTEYSHCWILYVFHLNTDLDKLWMQPSRSKLKAKVRVPRLKGGKMGVLATRSPHRPCPIGLTVAKVEAVSGCMILLSGVDLVDGTPVLDIKPYLPSDSIEGAMVPKWLTEDNPLIIASVNFSPGFSSTLNTGWQIAQKSSLYASPDEFKSLITQVLSWDIRSVSQRKYPHNTASKKVGRGRDDLMMRSEGDETDSELDCISNQSMDPGDITYRLILEGVEVSYRIDRSLNVIVEKAAFSSHIEDKARNQCNYIMWRDILART